MSFLLWLESKDLKTMASKAKLDIKNLNMSQLKMGYDVEKEHGGTMGKDTDIIKNPVDCLKIVVAHLREDPKYYTKLKKVED